LFKENHLLAANVYDCFVILDSNRYARDAGAVRETLESAVTKLDGEILVSRLYNEQKLAYPINGHRKGTYWLMYFKLGTDKLTTFERTLQLDDNVLRSMTLKVHPKLIEPLVAHAKGEALTESEDSTGETASADTSDTEAAATS
jgi:small subunit ribosomal protein S6